MQKIQHTLKLSEHPLKKLNRKAEVVFAVKGFDDKYLLVRKAGNPSGIYRLPSGGIESNELPQETVVREIKEEFQVTPDKFTFAVQIDFVFELPDGTKNTFQTNIFIADVFEEITLEHDHEHEGHIWLDKSDIVPLIPQFFAPDIPTDRVDWCIWRGTTLEIFNNYLDQLETAIFGAGCFWGVEEEFRKLDGVIQTQVGYCGGNRPNPTYEQVCSSATGHAECVKVWFDPKIVSYASLLDKFWSIHDPTTLNRQGPDIGTQYRSVIFVTSESQKTTAAVSIEAISLKLKNTGEVVTEIKEAPEFYKAEEYHQKYFKKHGLNACPIL